MNWLFIITTSFGLMGCSSVFYFPEKREFVDRSKLPVKPEDLLIKTSDGENLHAWYFKTPKGKPKGLIVQFHGNGQNQSTHFLYVYEGLNYGFDLLTFDYRGYGVSTGKPTPQGTVKDGKAVLNWVLQNKSSLPLIVIGQSLGGAVAMKTLEEMHGQIPVQLLVLDSTFASYRSAARGVASAHWLTWIFQPFVWLLVDNSASPQDDLEKLAPYKKLVIHGQEDKVVNFNLGKDLFESLPEPKEFRPIHGGHHTDFLWREAGQPGRKFYQDISGLTLPPGK